MNTFSKLINGTLDRCEICKKSFEELKIETIGDLTEHSKRCKL